MNSALLLEIKDKLSKIQQRNKILRKRFLKGDEIAVVSEIEKNIKKGSIDSDTLHCFIELILVSNDPLILKKYSLPNLNNFLEFLCKLYPDDIDLNLEYYFFLFNVLDNEKKAKTHFKKFSDKVINKIHFSLEW